MLSNMLPKSAVVDERLRSDTNDNYLQNIENEMILNIGELARMNFW